MGKFACEDGRAFTDYRPSCVMNKMIANNNEVGNSLEYRKFLQLNADRIREMNLKAAVEKNRVVCNCYKCDKLSKQKF
jgi:hypothetical protein